MLKRLRSRLACAGIKRLNPTDTYQIDIQLTAAKHLHWLIDTVETEGPELAVKGWSLCFAQEPADIRFLLNGKPFEFVEWPLPSNDVGEFYGHIPGAKQARFVLRQRIATWSNIFPGGYARFSAVNRLGEHPRSYRTYWYYPDPHNNLAVPDGARIARVIAGGMQSFLLGGATTAKRFDRFLNERFGRPLTSFSSILDWGCGAGRVTRHLIQMGCPAITGADIDPDNIQWCQDNFKRAEFFHLQLHPPTPFEDGKFDLVIGVSVMTHLAEAEQFLWLSELQRITKPGSPVLLSIHGPAQWSLYKRPWQHYVAVERNGFIDSGHNAQLDGVVADQSFYRNVDHSRDYIFANWSKYFEVLDIVDAIATHQDLVVLRRR